LTPIPQIIDTYKVKSIFPLILAVLVICGVTIWVTQRHQAEEMKLFQAATTTTKGVNGKTRIEMTSQNNSGKQGWVTIREIEYKTWISVNIPTGGEDEAGDRDYPLTFYDGSCNKTGPLVYKLTTIEDGGSETWLKMKLSEFKKNMPLALVATDPQTSQRIACADISVLYN
jgi:hypothetical protein